MAIGGAKLGYIVSYQKKKNARLHWQKYCGTSKEGSKIFRLGILKYVIIMSWVLNFIKKKATSLKYSDSKRIVGGCWGSLWPKEIMLGCLKQQIDRFKQGDLCIGNYYAKCKAIWCELEL